MEKELKGWVKCPVCEQSKGRTISYRETRKDIPEKGALKCSICGKSKVVIYNGAKGEVSVTCSNCGHINHLELSSMVITHGEIIGNQLKRKTA